MNSDHLEKLCNALDLGKPIEMPSRVYGGFTHKIWHLKTDLGAYAIKQIYHDFELTQERIAHFNLTESVAKNFYQANIPAVSAINKRENFIQLINDTGYLVYPWIEGRKIGTEEVSNKHAIIIAKTLSKMHKVNLHIPSLSNNSFNKHGDTLTLKYFQDIRNVNYSIYTSLEKHIDIIAELNKLYLDSLSYLKTDLVVSHSDLDQKNVLWEKEVFPMLIDWDTATYINRSYDLISTALLWSGIMSCNVNMDIFREMIKIYSRDNEKWKPSAEELNAAVNGNFGNAFGMLYFNIQKLLNNPIGSEEFQRAVERITKALNTIIYFNKMHEHFKSCVLEII